ncbi:DNA repair protein RecN [Brachymonas denitrificans]|uniref:DNA repair protein RecN n=1 Tax=Brachymonas denitrificans TaxID=28220 RepID=UPI002AFF03EB|nr:DNA repair protein RecN [Brachymonas denitrificans]
MALRRIALQDFVIVQALDLDVHNGFTVLTGETGAGKSILVDALQLVMGARADAGFVREGCTRTDITAHFDITPALAPLLDEYGIEADAEEGLLLRRLIDSQGKSRGWINGTPATATQLRALGSLLVDIHGQHAWQSLMQPASTRTLLDGYGRIDTAPIRTLWQQWQAAREKLEQAAQGQEQRQQERERLQWQVAEVDKLSPQADEWPELNSEHQRLAHAQQLLDAAGTALQALEGEQHGLLDTLHTAIHALQEQEHIEPAFAEWIALLASSQTQLEEAQRGLHSYLNRTELDPDRLAQLDQRLSGWISLARRFRVQPEDLAATWSGWQQQLQELDAAEDLEALQQAEQSARSTYQDEATRLTQLRQKAALQLGQSITEAMQQLGMQGGRFVVDVAPAPQPAGHGADAIDFLVAGHAGSTPRPIAKVASGGELSRIALAIAVTTSQLGTAPTLIFDEVDAGVGGKVAHTVGQLMQQLGLDRQVLAVTHLPQVAACADHHLRVFKTASGAQTATVSSAEMLAEGERLHEIARMLGGDAESATTLAHAGEMLQQARARTPA